MVDVTEEKLNELVSEQQQNTPINGESQSGSGEQQVEEAKSTELVEDDGENAEEKLKESSVEQKHEGEKGEEGKDG